MQCKFFLYKYYKNELILTFYYHYCYRFVYNTAVHSGIFDYFRRWILAYTPPDTRIILLIIGYSFGALLEGKKMKRFHVVQILKFCGKKKRCRWFRNSRCHLLFINGFCWVNYIKMGFTIMH